MVPPPHDNAKNGTGVPDRSTTARAKRQTFAMGSLRKCRPCACVEGCSSVNRGIDWRALNFCCRAFALALLSPNQTRHRAGRCGRRGAPRARAQDWHPPRRRRRARRGAPPPRDARADPHNALVTRRRALRSARLWHALPPAYRWALRRPRRARAGRARRRRRRGRDVEQRPVGAGAARARTRLRL